jgi:putative oxygen-independent coproporphyrinogen III oxidase
VSAAPLSLYIHIPFCTLKCSYCDFNSYAGIEGLMGPFVEALCHEVRLWGAALGDEAAAVSEAKGEALSRPGVPPGRGGSAQMEVLDTVVGASPLHSRRRPVETVFFGGGTPSLLPLEEVERIMVAMFEAFDLTPGAEVSFEANPGTIDLNYLRGLMAAGVNRISFGVQSFHDDELASLDRIHSAEEAKEAFRWAREAGFERVNLDLIYGLVDQGMERWRETLEEAIALGPEHLSLYALTVEEGTKLAHDIERGHVPAPDGDLQAAMYEWSCERLAAAGYRQYEISNWCRQGEECRHNLVYWRNGEWLGLGPGAHSHLRSEETGARSQGWRFADVYSPKRYIELVRETVEARARSKGSGLRANGTRDVIETMRQVAFVEEQTVEMEMADTAILGLRLNDGLDVDEFSRRFGRSLEEVYGEVLKETGAFGLVERENGRVRLTERGRLLANEVFVRLLAD